MRPVVVWWGITTGTPIFGKTPCQDMKPGPVVLLKIIQFLCKIECIECECNEIVLVLVQIDLIHFEHSICISST